MGVARKKRRADRFSDYAMQAALERERYDGEERTSL